MNWIASSASAHPYRYEGGSSEVCGGEGTVCGSSICRIVAYAYGSKSSGRGNMGDESERGGHRYMGLPFSSSDCGYGHGAQQSMHSKRTVAAFCRCCCVSAFVPALCLLVLYTAVVTVVGETQNVTKNASLPSFGSSNMNMTTMPIKTNSSGIGNITPSFRVTGDSNLDVVMLALAATMSLVTVTAIKHTMTNCMFVINNRRTAVLCPCLSLATHSTFSCLFFDADSVRDSRALRANRVQTWPSDEDLQWPADVTTAVAHHTGGELRSTSATLAVQPRLWRVR